MIQQSPTPAVSTGTSLQLKPEKGEPLPAQQTPSRTEGSEQTPLSRATENVNFVKQYALKRNTGNSRTEGGKRASLHGVTDDTDPVGGSCTQSGSTYPHGFPQNDLDKAIEVAQATKNLVRISKLVFVDYALTV